MPPARLDHSFFDGEVRPHLGSILLERGLVKHDQLDQALEERARTGELLGETLVRLGYVFEDELARVLAAQEGLEFVDVAAVSADPSAAALLDMELSDRLRAIPLRFTDEALVVAVADPLMPGLRQRLEEATGWPVKLVVTTPSAVSTGWRLIRRRRI
ncbi:MAG: hypothetical protein WBB74_09930 [Gaiellaceae bacterium]